MITHETCTSRVSILQGAFFSNWNWKLYQDNDYQFVNTSNTFNNWILLEKKRIKIQFAFLTIVGIEDFLLQEFNPALMGYAKTDSLTIQSESRLNVAEIGAMSKDMPYMAKILLKRIKNDPKIDVKKHWKVNVWQYHEQLWIIVSSNMIAFQYITFMIGPNDFCSDICWMKSPWIALKNHKRDLIETLRILRDNLPRTFVGLIPPPHLQTLVELNHTERTSFFCDIMTNLECSCLFGLKFRHFRQEYYDVMRK